MEDNYCSSGTPEEIAKTKKSITEILKSSIYKKAEK
jgi:hypothetical protein